MSLGNIVDELHNQHSLANTGTAKETDLATLSIWCQQIYHLHHRVHLKVLTQAHIKRSQQLQHIP